MVTVEKKMTQSEIQEFLMKPNLARVGTLNPDGSPHVTPIWFLYADGAVTFSVGKSTQKARNLSRDSQVCLCIDEREHPNRTVILNGYVISTGDTSKEYRLRISVHYLGEERGREYAQEMEDFPSIAYRVEPTKIISWYYVTQQ